MSTPTIMCFSSANSMKIKYAKRIGCTKILGHDGVEIQDSPSAVAPHKCITTFADAKKAGHVGVVDGKVVGLFTEDTAVAPNKVYKNLGAYASSFVKAGNATGLSLYEQFAPYTKESPLCIYSSTVSITFDGENVTTITCMVECECVPELKGNGGKIDACMVPIRVISLTLKDGDTEEKILQLDESIDSGGKTYSEYEECCDYHPRTIAFKALVALCEERGWLLV